MIRTLIELLGNFYARNDYINFEAIARSLLSTIPNDQVSLQFLGLVYYRTGRISDAIRIFDKVVRRRKPVPVIESEKTSTNLAHSDFATAACYLEATRQNPELAQAWHGLGLVLLDLKKYEQAIAAFRSALIAEPELTDAMLEIGRTALRVGDSAAAEEVFSRLRELQPNNAEAYRGLARVYRKRRDFATARACFVRIRMLCGECPGIDNLTGKRCSFRASSR